MVKLETAWWALAEMPEQNRKESIQVGGFADDYITVKSGPRVW